MSTPRAITRRTLACRATPTSPSSEALKGSDEMAIRSLGMMGEDGRRTGIFNMCHLDFALWPSASLVIGSDRFSGSVLSTPRAAAPGRPPPPPPPLRPGSRPPQTTPPPVRSLHPKRGPSEPVRGGRWMERLCAPSVSSASSGLGSESSAPGVVGRPLAARSRHSMISSRPLPRSIVAVSDFWRRATAGGRGGAWRRAIPGRGR